MTTKKLTKEERRESLIQAAATLFMDKGYHETKTKDIALAAGITEPVIYKHFSSKEELFFEVIYRTASCLIDKLNIHENTDPKEFMKNFISLHMSIVEKNFESIKFLLVQILQDAKVRDAFRHTLLPRVKSKIHPLIKILNPQKAESAEYHIFLLSGMLMISELAHGLFKSTPENLSTEELSEKLADTFIKMISGGREND